MRALEKGSIKYRPDIDGLRAVAVLVVIGFHAFPKAVPGGFVGVDIFFVISGFLISSILYGAFRDPTRRPRAVIAHFYGRRVRRIFPSLIVILAVSYALGFVWLLSSAFAQLSLHIAASAGFCLNFLLSATTGYFNSDAASMPLLHLWSLGVEEQFYLAWPLVVWVVIRGNINLLRTAVFLAACSFFLNEYKATASAAADFFLPQMRFWELSIGSIAAACYPSIQKALGNEAEIDGRPAQASAIANVATFLGSALIGLGLLLITNKPNVPDVKMLLPTLGAALVISSGQATWINRRLLSLRALVWIGLISYPLYLWHWPLLSLSQTILGDDDSLAIKLSAIAAATALAWLTYLLVERPIRDGRAGALKTAVLLASMTVVGVLGFATYRERGFPNRFPPFIRAMENITYDYGKDWRAGTYFLDPTQNETAFKSDTGDFRKDRPTLYLWGDSHAASLYCGYKKYYGGDYNIVQRTATATPPLLGEDIDTLPNAQRINQYVFDSIRREKPDTVVLAANWGAHKWQDLAVTITALRGAGIRHIVVVGPLPQWVGSLPQQLLNSYARNRFGSLPFRLKSGASEGPAQVDALIGPFCRRLGVAYVSPCGILGNQDGFLVRLGDTVDTLVSFDSSHLTRAGSEYLVSHFPKE